LTFRREFELCFDQVEFLTGFTFCSHVISTPMNISENAHWPLYGNNKLSVKLEMVDALTFRAEFDDKGKCKSFFFSFFKVFFLQNLESPESTSTTTHPRTKTSTNSFEVPL
jgi:hypothetical protein